MASIDSFGDSFLAYKSRDNNFQTYCETLKSISAKLDAGVVADLSRAKSCLSLGTGNGRFELEFIKNLAPNLQSFTAVEPHGPSVAELKQSLQRQLPNIESVVHEITIEQCSDVIQQSFDVVLLFSILVLVDPDYRDTLCRKVLPRWTAPNGLVVFSMFNRAERPDSFNKLLDKLNPDYVVPTYEDFERMIIDDDAVSGQPQFRLETSFEVQYFQNLGNPDDTVLQILRGLVRKDVSIEDARRVIYESWPDGKTDHRYMKYDFFRKTS